MKADNSFEGAKLRLESTQQEIIMNIAYSLSFCNEIIRSIVATQDVSLLLFRKRVRMLIRINIDFTVNRIATRFISSSCTIFVSNGKRNSRKRSYTVWQIASCTKGFQTVN